MMRNYLELINLIATNGQEQIDRTGVGTRSMFGTRMTFDCGRDGNLLPMLTAKRVPFKAVLAELLWFLRGDTNVKWLHEQQCTIWDEWADENGNLGPVYGAQWRQWGMFTSGVGVDQMRNLIEKLKANPHDRGHVVSAWNVEELQYMALRPCHMFFQCYVRENKYLDLQMYQRSADMFLGVPFNITSYCILMHMIAKLVGLKAGEFIWIGGDTHVYLNHMEQVREMLKRPYIQGFPTLKIEGCQETIDDFKMSDFVLENYQSHGVIKAPVAI